MTVMMNRAQNGPQTFGPPEKQHSPILWVCYGVCLDEWVSVEAVGNVSKCTMPAMACNWSLCWLYKWKQTHPSHHTHSSTASITLQSSWWQGLLLPNLSLLCPLSIQKFVVAWMVTVKFVSSMFTFHAAYNICGGMDGYYQSCMVSVHFPCSILVTVCDHAQWSMQHTGSLMWPWTTDCRCSILEWMDIQWHVPMVRGSYLSIPTESCGTVTVPKADDNAKCVGQQSLSYYYNSTNGH